MNVDERTLGEHPDLDETAKTLIAFRAAITCKHGIIAPTCGQGCRRPNWLDCLVRRKSELDPEEKQRTVGDVVEEFISAGRIPSIEVVQRYVEGEQRKERRRRYRKFAMFAGVTVASGVLLYEGGKLILRLWSDRKEKQP